VRRYRFVSVVAALVLAITAGAAHAQSVNADLRWGRIANAQFDGQRIRSTLFFSGSAKDGSSPYGYQAPANTHLYTVNPADNRHLTWSQAAADRDFALSQMVDVGINVISLSSWGENFLLPQDSWGLWAPMQCAPKSHDELFAAAVGKPLTITPFIESRANWTMRGEFPTWNGQVAPGTVSQINNLVDRYLKNTEHPEWADKWTKVYDRNGEERYAVSLIHASSDRLSPNDHAAYAAGFDAMAQKVFDDTGVKVGFFLDVLPKDSPWAPGVFRPTAQETGPELAERASILGLQNFIPEIWANVADEAARIDWKRDFSQGWSETGIPFLMDVSPGYDAQLVFPGSVEYGFTETWTSALTDMVSDYGQDGLIYNSWNGFAEGMAGMPSLEYGTTHYNWLSSLTQSYIVPEPSSLLLSLLGCLGLTCVYRLRRRGTAS
jgi:hypothetical protein